MSMRRTHIIWFWTFSLWLLLGRGVWADSCADPDTLRILFNFGPETSNNINQKMSMEEYLSETIGKKIIIMDTVGYDQLMIALKNKRIDLAWIGANTFVNASDQQHGIEAFAAYYHAGSQVQLAGIGYQSLLVVRGESQFKSIESLRDTTLALVDPGSTSGFLVPTVFFEELIDTSFEEYFKKILMSGRHIRSIKAVANAKVDAAFVSSGSLSKVLTNGNYNAEDFVVLWRSPTIPSGPFIYRKSLCREIKDKISNTFLQAHLHPQGKIWLKELNVKKIVPSNSANFDIIRRLHQDRHRNDKQRAGSNKNKNENGATSKTN